MEREMEKSKRQESITSIQRRAQKHLTRAKTHVARAERLVKKAFEILTRKPE
jgi:hypothetical protein